MEVGGCQRDQSDSDMEAEALFHGSFPCCQEAMGSLRGGMHITYKTCPRGSRSYRTVVGYGDLLIAASEALDAIPLSLRIHVAAREPEIVLQLL